jgi:hypothetical protein
LDKNKQTKKNRRETQERKKEQAKTLQHKWVLTQRAKRAPDPILQIAEELKEGTTIKYK